MPYRMFKVVASCCLVLAAAAAAVAQTPPVKIKFEVDGKEYRQPIRIFIAAHYDEFKPPIIEPRVKDDGFIFPPGLDGLRFDEVSVRVVCGKYTLEFTEVEVGKFTGQLIFGVDHRPFDPEFLKFRTPEEKERLAVLHYIKFIPEDGDPTWMTVGTNR